MTTANLNNLAHTSDGVSSQLNLPVGPFAALRGGRRERTDEDKAWYGEQFKVDHDRPVDSAVYIRLAYYGSLNVGRLAFPSVARLARECSHISERTAQRALRRLEARGIIACLNRKGGHKPGTYLVVGAGVVPGPADCHPWGDKVTPEVIREGNNQETKNLLSAIAHTQDPALSVNPQKEILESLDLPSPEKARAPVPNADPIFQNPAQVRKLFKLQRKLDYQANDQQAIVFDGLEHPDKKRIIDRLEAEEQIAAANGEVAPPPKKPKAPRAEVAVERKPKPERPSCVEHRWTPPASDGIQNCYDCDEET